jgi:hypothetical protein
MEDNYCSAQTKKSFVKRIGRAIIWFFAVMLVLTFLSRAVSDALKAKVSVGYVSNSALDLSLSGTGTWTPGDTLLFTTYYTRRITKVYVQPGQSIREGDPLFAYDVATVSGGKTVTDRKVLAAQKALEVAKANLESATDPAYAEASVQNAERALEFAQFTYAQTFALQNGGVVCATFSGTLLSCDLSAGKASVAGESGLQISLGAPQFLISISTKQAEKISIGDSVCLYRDGKQEDKTAEVVSVSTPDMEGSVEVICRDNSDEMRVIGAKQEWKIRKQSKQYDTCVPLEALRQGGADEYYVFVLTGRQTILGEQLEAQKVYVDLVAHDDSHAAIDCDLAGDEKLITTCSKEIQDGDLVVENDGD